MCEFPKEIRNKRYIPNKTNKGFPPIPIDNRLRYIEVPCGQCIQCRKKKARDWMIRLKNEVESDGNARGFTLSYSEEAFIELTKAAKTNSANTIAKLSVKRFRERYREKYGKSPKHWIVTEIGSKNTKRLHLHGIIWTTLDIKEIERLWKYGNVVEGRKVTRRTTKYMTKYMTKNNIEDKGYKSIVLSSPRIGISWLESKDAERAKYISGNTKEYIRTTTGHKIGLPDYYRKKIYTNTQREKLQLEKMDKGTRFVNGTEIDIMSKEYADALKHRQYINTELGYGPKFIPKDKKVKNNE